MRHIRGMAIFLYQNCSVQAWILLLSSCSTSESRKSPDATKQTIHNKSWNTFTIEVNTSPTYVKKNVGDTKGAVITFLMALHNGIRVFKGKIKHFIV
mmetsp:Transcript_2135/g.3942  ORF Transcript_2135/g.3942 Transcript_2135/m.3942 type:complete len:97 (-) Transcript_2135:1060-1350(-)